MAIKATIHKAQLQIADMDRGVYADHNVIIARHPSETDERMMIRLLAFALNVPADDKRGHLEFAKDLWDVDEAALWHKDYTDAVASQNCNFHGFTFLELLLINELLRQI